MRPVTPSKLTLEDPIRVVPNHWNPGFHAIEGQTHTFAHPEQPGHFETIEQAVQFIECRGRVAVVDRECKRWAADPHAKVDGAVRTVTNGDDRGYFGAKSGAGVAERIICQIPPHEQFIEAFAGSAAVSRRKLPCRSSTIVIDADGHQCNKLRRVPGLTVVCGDAIKWLEKHQTGFKRPGTVIYLDPPYLFEARSTGNRKRYGIEFGEEWLHGQLLDCLKQIAASGVPVLINHPRHPLYDRMLTGWRVIDYTYGTHGGKFADALWCSFDPPTRLHDYRFVGDGYRERERINRKVKRWQSKFKTLPALERRVILDALTDVDHRQL